MALLFDSRPDGQGGKISSDLLATMERVQLEMGTSPIEDAVFDLARSRRNIRVRAELAARDLQLPSLATTTRQLLTPNGQIELRTYNPKSTGPAIVFVHGGGWIAGSIDTHDGMARWFASQADATLISLGYSLAPEHPFPQAVVEVAAAIAAVERDLEPGRRLFVMGDSSGANIAAMAILRLPPAQRTRINGFVSIYGAYSPEMDLSSHRLYGDGRFGLSEARMRWCWTLYAPEFFPEARDQLTPLGSIPADFPPTLCVGAECDVLLDDTLAFYSRLAEARVDVSLSLWPGLPHGCLHYVGVVDSVTNAARSIVQYIDTHRVSPRVLEVPGRLTARPQEAGPTEVLRNVDALFDSSRTRLHGSVTHMLATDIVGGKLQPGQTLPTEEAASAGMGISRSAYREALRTLAAKGLLLSSPKVGTRIAPREKWSILDVDVLAWSFEAAPSDQFVRDLFELRKSIEPSAASMAADRRDEGDIAVLSNALRRLASTTPDSIEWLHASVDYHRAILLASKNAALPGLWPVIDATLRWTVKLQMMLPTLQLVHDPVAAHAQVFEKISTQDAAAAQLEMRSLIEMTFVDAIANLGRVRRAAPPPGRSSSVKDTSAAGVSA